MGHAIIPLAAIGLPLVLVPTIILLKHRHEKRQWQHLERMQAIASGAPVRPGGSTPGTGAVIAIGAGVPMVAVVAALITTANARPYQPDSLAQSAVAWGCAFLISAGALGTSLILGILQHRAHAKANSQYVDASYESPKPTHDPDSFDVVSRRG